MSDLPVSTSDVTQTVKIRLGEDGQSAKPPTTVMKNFDNIVQNHGNSKALHQKLGKDVRRFVGKKTNDVATGALFCCL
jgi:hypothetical protein